MSRDQNETNKLNCRSAKISCQCLIFSSINRNVYEVNCNLFVINKFKKIIAIDIVLLLINIIIIINTLQIPSLNVQ